MPPSLLSPLSLPSPRHDTGRLSSLARVCQDGKMVVKRTKDITAAEFKLSERNSREKGELWLSSRVP